MYELKKMERYSRINMLGPGPRLTKKRIYRVAVSQSLRNTAMGQSRVFAGYKFRASTIPTIT